MIRLPRWAAKLLKSERRVTPPINPEKYPPRDWRDDAAWERYWTTILADPDEKRWHTGIFTSAALSHIEFLRTRRLRRLLFAGNGITLEPHAFVHCGFDVTALDVSPSACRFVETVSVDKKNLIRFLPEYEERRDRYGHLANYIHEKRSLKRIAREHRPGGCMTVLAESLFTHTPTAPYDFIHSNKAIQGFAAPDRQTLAHRFFEWLAPGGFCLIETINVAQSHRDALENVFLEAGFVQHPLETADDVENENRPCGPEAWQARVEARDAARSKSMDAGQKVVDFWYSSG